MDALVSEGWNGMKDGHVWPCPQLSLNIQRCNCVVLEVIYLFLIIIHAGHILPSMQRDLCSSQCLYIQRNNPLPDALAHRYWLRPRVNTVKWILCPRIILSEYDSFAGLVSWLTLSELEASIPVQSFQQSSSMLLLPVLRFFKSSPHLPSRLVN